jgi:hypothetical protein
MRTYGEDGRAGVLRDEVRRGLAERLDARAHRGRLLLHHLLPSASTPTRTAEEQTLSAPITHSTRPANGRASFPGGGGASTRVSSELANEKSEAGRVGEPGGGDWENSFGSMPVGERARPSICASELSIREVSWRGVRWSWEADAGRPACCGGCMYARCMRSPAMLRALSTSSHATPEPGAGAYTQPG